MPATDDPLAHIAGIPVEETALAFGPVLLAGGGIATLKVRERLERAARPPPPAVAVDRLAAPLAPHRPTLAHSSPATGHKCARVPAPLTCGA